MKIEPMKLEDLDQVMIIEQASFKQPWERSFFKYDLKRPGGHLFVAKDGDEILGYIDAWQITDEMHLANIAVTLNYRHIGIASQLLSKLIELAKENNCQDIFLEVRASNEIAQKFYEKFGFVKGYKREKYYPDGEDAIIYRKRLVD
jgi:ribosomal-protein-alanine N-acetyltransferase